MDRALQDVGAFQGEGDDAHPKREQQDQHRSRLEAEDHLLTGHEPDGQHRGDGQADAGQRGPSARLMER